MEGQRILISVFSAASTKPDPYSVCNKYGWKKYSLSNKVGEKDLGQTVESKHFTVKGTFDMKSGDLE